MGGFQIWRLPLKRLVTIAILPRYWAACDDNGKFFHLNNSS